MLDEIRERPLLPVELIGRTFELALASFLAVLGMIFVTPVRPAVERVKPVLRRRVGPVVGAVRERLGLTGRGKGEQPVPAAAAPPAGVAGPVGADEVPGGWRWMAAVTYVLAVLAWALFTILHRVDSAVRQMTVDGRSAGSALGFPVSPGDLGSALDRTAAQAAVDATHDTWRAYEQALAAGTTLRSPHTITERMVWVDLAFVLVYALLLAVVLLVLTHAEDHAEHPAPGSDPDAGKERLRRRRMLTATWYFLGLLVLVDLVEDWQLHRSVAEENSLHALPFGIAVGPLMTLLKWPLTAAVLVPIVFLGARLAFRDHKLRTALKSVRGLLYVVAVVVLLLSFGVGAAQADDVVRAWSVTQAVTAVTACLVLSFTVAGVARHQTGTAQENPAPDRGRDAQPLLLGSAVLLVLAGLLLRLLGLGWGLAAAGGILAVLWLLGQFVDPADPWQPRPSAGGAGRIRQIRLAAAVAGGVLGGVLLTQARVLGVVTGAYGGLLLVGVWQALVERPPAGRAEPGAAESAPIEAPADVRRWGDRLARLTGALVAATLVVTVARATALDAYVRENPADSVLVPLVGAVGAGVVGLLVTACPAGRGSRAAVLTWVAGATLALVALACSALVDMKTVGTVGVLFVGFTIIVGVLAGLATTARRRPLNGYRLVPGLRSLRFTRFPVVLFLVLWLFVVSAGDPGGHHDIRRMRAAGTTAAPTLQRAWLDYLGPGKPAAGTPRPVVFVAAQGGGIRAAIWTALVMECVFGPGPVGRTGEVCAAGSGEPAVGAMAAAAAEPTPVFLASGASGGSVGLAVWSARRADLIQDGAASRTPATLEDDALDGDFVASDVAGMLLGDVPHAFLAGSWRDRATVLEHSWETTWQSDRDARRGLARGLRETYDVTHAAGWGTPVLAFNGLSVEDGCRFVASAVDFTLPVGRSPIEVSSAEDRPNDAACRGVGGGTGMAVDVLPATNELIDYLCTDEDVPLSTAAHISARFPYVSPTGRVERRDCATDNGLVPRPGVSYDADGGFFDNSGAGTVVDTWRALTPLANDHQRLTGACVVPLFLQIDNSPPEAVTTAAADSRPSELVAPITATLNQVSSRDRYARAGAASAFAHLSTSDGRTVSPPQSVTTRESAWFRVALYGQPGPEPPLGWTLAPHTVDDMRSQLNAAVNADAIRTLRNLLDRAENLPCP